MTLFHVSDDPGVAIFSPRPSPHTAAPVVWSVDAAHLVNYLLPRDCPRVCFRGDTPVVAIEEAWADRVAAARLWLYAFGPEGFRLQDRVAGYWVSESPVVPLGITELVDLPALLAKRGAELRVLPELWTLHDEVIAAGLDFSIIRMRNAQPRS